MWARLLSRQSKTEYVPILCVLHSPKHIWGKIQKPFTSYHHRHHHHLVACCMLLVVLDEIARPRRGLFTRFGFFCQSSRSFCLIIAVLLSIYKHDLNKMNGVQPTMRVTSFRLLEVFYHFSCTGMAKFSMNRARPGVPPNSLYTLLDVCHISNKMYNKISHTKCRALTQSMHDLVD